VNWGWILEGINTLTPFEDDEVDPCDVRFYRSPACKLPIANNFRSVKARDYPKWTGFVEEKMYMDRTDIRVEYKEYEDYIGEGKPPQCPGSKCPLGI